MMVIYGPELMILFQLVNMKELPIEALIQKNTENALDVIHEVFAIQDNKHEKAANSINKTYVR